MTVELILSIIGAVFLPISGWTLTKVVQHERKIAVLETIAIDIAASLDLIRRNLERIEDRTYDRPR